jgi:hypothetical protein
MESLEYRFDRVAVTLVSLRPSGCHHVKMWRRRILLEGETITSKINGPGGYYIRSASISLERCQISRFFAAALIRRGLQV